MVRSLISGTIVLYNLSKHSSLFLQICNMQSCSSGHRTHRESSREPPCAFLQLLIAWAKLLRSLIPAACQHHVSIPRKKNPQMWNLYRNLLVRQINKKTWNFQNCPPSPSKCSLQGDPDKGKMLWFNDSTWKIKTPTCLVIHWWVTDDLEISRRPLPALSHTSVPCPVGAWPFCTVAPLPARWKIHSTPSAPHMFFPFLDECWNYENVRENSFSKCFNSKVEILKVQFFQQKGYDMV